MNDNNILSALLLALAARDESRSLLIDRAELAAIPDGATVIIQQEEGGMRVTCVEGTTAS